MRLAEKFFTMDYKNPKEREIEKTIQNFIAEVLQEDGEVSANSSNLSTGQSIGNNAPEHLIGIVYPGSPTNRISKAKKGKFSKKKNPWDAASSFTHS